MRGFTLLELMVTLAVAAVLLALAVPSFTEYFAKSRVRGAADDLTNQLALARAGAMRADRDVVVSVVGTGATWCSGGRQFSPVGTIGVVQAVGAVACDCSSVAAADGKATCLVSDLESLVDSAQYQNVELVSIAGTANLQFDRKVGVLTDLAPRTLILRSTKFPTRFILRLVVSPLGHARVCVPSGAAPFGGYTPC